MYYGLRGLWRRMTEYTKDVAQHLLHALGRLPVHETVCRAA